MKKSMTGKAMKEKLDKKFDKGMKEMKNEHMEADNIKKTGKFQGKSNKLGGGGRFKQLVAQGKSPALAAYIGRKKYGAKKMASMAAKGKKA